MKLLHLQKKTRKKFVINYSENFEIKNALNIFHR